MSAMDFAVFLQQHPSAGHRIDASMLPLPAKDPFPAFTFSLHGLWSMLRPSLRWSSEGAPSLFPGRSGETPEGLVLRLSPALVSAFPFCPCFRSSNNICFSF